MPKRDLVDIAVFLVVVVALAATAVLFLGTQIGVMLTTQSGAIGEVNHYGNYGNWDTPEGATPLPKSDPSAAALGVPLLVDHLTFPLDHTGDYAIPVGEAILPNGYLSDMRLTVANGKNETYLLDGIWIELRPAPDASPFPDNVYNKGLVEGPQRVFVYVRFGVQSFDPGAVVEVRDLFVR